MQVDGFGFWGLGYASSKLRGLSLGLVRLVYCAGVRAKGFVAAGFGACAFNNCPDKDLFARFRGSGFRDLGFTVLVPGFSKACAEDVTLMVYACFRKARLM